MSHKINKDKKMAERFLAHALEIIYLLTGEEYTIVKKNSPNSRINKLTEEIPLKCDDIAVYFSMDEWEYIEGHKERYKDVMPDNQRTFRNMKTTEKEIITELHEKHMESVSSTKKEEIKIEGKDIKQVEIHLKPSAGVKKENLDIPATVGEKEEKIEEKEILQVTIHSDVCEGVPNTEIVHPVEQIDVPRVANQLGTMRQGIHQNVNLGLRDQNIYPVLIDEEGEYENVEREIQQMEIYSGSWTGEVPSRTNNGQYPKSCGPSHSATGDISVMKSCYEANNNRTTLCNNPGNFMPKAFYPHVDGTHPKAYMTPNTDNVLRQNMQLIFSSNVINNSTRGPETYPTEKRQCGGEWGANAFSYKSQLAPSQTIKTEEKPFACLQCGKCFVQKSQLSVHRRIHMETKPFACTQCSKSFTRKWQLGRHQQLHTGEKPFECTTCKKRFTQKAQSIIHQRIHTGEKPFACSDCGKSFISKAHLGVHQRGHLL